MPARSLDATPKYLDITRGYQVLTPGDPSGDGFQGTVGDFTGEFLRQMLSMSILAAIGPDGVSVVAPGLFNNISMNIQKSSEEFKQKHGTNEPSFIPGVSKKALVESIQPITELALSLLASRMGGKGISAVTKSPNAALVGSMGAAGVADYRRAAAGAIGVSLNDRNHKLIEDRGYQMSKEEEEHYRKRDRNEAAKHGFWEAIPGIVIGHFGDFSKLLAKIMDKSTAGKMMEELASTPAFKSVTNAAGSVLDAVDRSPIVKAMKEFVSTPVGKTLQKAAGTVAGHIIADAISGAGQKRIKERAGKKPPAGAPPADAGSGTAAAAGKQGLPSHYFQYLESALKAGVDPEGNPFSIHDVRKILEDYRKSPQADPASIRNFETILERVQTAPAAGEQAQPAAPDDGNAPRSGTDDFGEGQMARLPYIPLSDSSGEEDRLHGAVRPLGRSGENRGGGDADRLYTLNGGAGDDAWGMDPEVPEGEEEQGNARLLPVPRRRKERWPLA
jgi:hypothetical protein